MHGNEKKNLDMRLEGFIWGLGRVNPAMKSGIQDISEQLLFSEGSEIVKLKGMTTKVVVPFSNMPVIS